MYLDKYFFNYLILHLNFFMFIISYLKLSKYFHLNVFVLFLIILKINELKLKFINNIISALIMYLYCLCATLNSVNALYYGK